MTHFLASLLIPSPRRIGALLTVLVTLLGLPSETRRAHAVGSQNLGATYDAAQVNLTFRVFSSRASRVEVWLYHRATGAEESARYPLTRDPNTNIWSRTVPVATLRALPGMTGPIYYGYRAWGPNWTYDPAWTQGSTAGFVADVDSAGNRFDPNKLLLDPYALEVSHDPQTPAQRDGTLYASGPRYRALDSGMQAPKGIALPPDATPVGPRPTRPFKDEIVYEVHLRGLTMNDPGIPAAARGTYRGAGLKAAALRALGITAVEFLPVHETQNDTNDLEASTRGDNYWGYSSYSFFAPDRRYAAAKAPGGPTREWKEMVRAFHDQGLKIYLDVVYNHTGEGGLWDGTGDVANLLSWRGLDNPTYYELTADNRFYCDNTGVNGNFNTAHPVVRNQIIDSLSYWKDRMGVDGFRFDLAPVLGNTFTRNGFRFDKLDPANALNRAVRELPVRPAGGGPGVDLIAEPWAIGGETQQQGNFPSGWAEWNDRFRDTFRKSQNRLGIDRVTPGDLATRFAGSADLFADDSRRPWHSVNFLVAHDGFTLRDLYAYNSKQNRQPWPYGPSDGGTDNNLSWDQGGDVSRQRQAARNGLALLMLSAGVPMITGGDEMYRTQYGNNNAYNLDSVKNWLDPADAATYPHFFAFARKLIAFRRAHPALRPAGFFTGADRNHNGLKDITWLRDDGREAGPDYMGDPERHFLAYRLDGSERGDPAASIYVAYNGWSGSVTATLPASLVGKRWYRVGDTAAWMEERDNCNRAGAEERLDLATYTLAGRSMLVLIEK